MRPDLAPNHVARIKELTREGFYDGVVFHRVIDGFMAQTGDPHRHRHAAARARTPKAEFSNATVHARHRRHGPRPGRPTAPTASSSSCSRTHASSNGQYTVWGQVIEGMDVVDQIKKAPAGRQSGMVDDPDNIISLKVEADIQ